MAEDEIRIVDAPPGVKHPRGGNRGFRSFIERLASEHPGEWAIYRDDIPGSVNVPHYKKSADAIGLKIEVEGRRNEPLGLLHTCYVRVIGSS